MKAIGVIGRTEWLFNSMVLLEKNGYKISFIITSKASPEYKIKEDQFELFAYKRGIPFINKSKTNLSDIKNLKINEFPRICISANYTGILDKKVIDLFDLGILNAHGGDLPRYKGNACQAWAIINGENRIGLCIHKMIPDEIDSGDIIERNYIDINLNTKIGEIFNVFETLIPKMFLDSIGKLFQNKNYVLDSQKTFLENGFRCYPRVPEDGKIDWGNNNIDIVRLINASNKPFQGAFFFYENFKVICWDAQVYNDSEKFYAYPGQISSVRNDGSVVVICGVGKIILKKIEINEKVINPNQLIKSIRKRLY
jgi:methionyl-tRNA formyltransferase